MTVKKSDRIPHRWIVVEGLKQRPPFKTKRYKKTNNVLQYYVPRTQVNRFIYDLYHWVVVNKILNVAISIRGSAIT